MNMNLLNAFRPLDELIDEAVYYYYLQYYIEHDVVEAILHLFGNQSLIDQKTVDEMKWYTGGIVSDTERMFR